jgi:hypothetical protein
MTNSCQMRTHTAVAFGIQVNAGETAPVVERHEQHGNAAQHINTNEALCSHDMGRGCGCDCDWKSGAEFSHNGKY